MHGDSHRGRGFIARVLYLMHWKSVQAVMLMLILKNIQTGWKCPINHPKMEDSLILDGTWEINQLHGGYFPLGKKNLHSNDNGIKLSDQTAHSNINV